MDQQRKSEDDDGTLSAKGPRPSRSLANRRWLAAGVMIALLAGMLALLSVAPAAQAFRVSLKATEHIRQFETPQNFGEHTPVRTSITSRGRHLRLEVSHGGCRGVFHGARLLVEIRVCGSGQGPLRLHYVSLNGRRSMRFAYSVAP